MGLLSLLPLFLATALLAIVLISPFVTRLDRAFTRLSLNLFPDIVERYGRKRDQRTELLQATHSTTTYTVFASKNLLFSIIAGVFSFVAGSYAGVAFISFLIAHKEAVKAALPRQLHFVVGAGSGFNPLGGIMGSVGGTGGGTSGGIAIPLEIPGWIASLVPGWLARGVGYIWASIPGFLKPTVSSGGGEGGTASAPSDIEILVVFPDLGIIPDSLAQLTAAQSLMLLFGALIIGVIGALAFNSLRWYDVKSRAKEREILIDESFVRTVAFVYALSQSGMLFPDILRTVARNRKAFGETAEELNIAVKHVDLLGADVITALERTAKWTPSEKFSEFLSHFTNVLKSGQNVPNYLQDRYEQAQMERMENQEQLLEYFTALGEAYVAILVAGPLFLISILTIFGILNGGLYIVLQLMIYLAIPLANFGFIAYLGSIGKTLSVIQVPTRDEEDRIGILDDRSFESGSLTEVVADGGVATVEENLRRLDVYNRVRSIRWAMKYPVETATSKPEVVLIIAVPIAAISVILRYWLHTGSVPASTLDDWLIQAGLLVTAPFAIVQEVNARRQRKIEAEVPEFLDSLASTNEAGRTFTESLKRLGSADFGVLGDEFQRLLTDIEWGARTEDALHRFSDRIGSPAVARVVALLTNALQASNQMGPVIRIAAEEARKARSLKKKRRQEMFMYVLIVYVSFVVFLGLTIALKTILVPAVPSADQLGNIASGQSFGIIVDPATGAQKEKYTQLLFHAAAVQAVVSGLVAGKMGEGSVKNGAKHATIMLAGAYLLFTFVG